MSQDFLPLLGTDHIEFWVGNAKQAAYYYQKAFGFELVAYAGPETGIRDRASYVLQQGKIRFVLTTAMQPDSEIAKHVMKHGDGVKVLALWVEDAEKSFYETMSRGAKAHTQPQTITDEFGEVRFATIHTYGETLHKFVERKRYTGAFMPGYKPAKASFKTEPIGLEYIDHCVGNVELGKMNEWVKFYEDVMGFKMIITFDDNDISTEYSALMSKVVSNGNGYVKFPINEPAAGKKKSQIDEYLEFYQGPGVQHIAIITQDVVKTVTELQNRGVDFLQVPGSYYDELEARVGKIDENIDSLRKLGILVDRDDEGYLLQIFTKPV
ncbi:MAG TPA: 4-hydroxyphenylpyruvate dioxygenase, partial [Bacteroidia bacterium]|nr:4-hydroxyphenylpyruvate dioxygenase [Bacteroidia bacterium]